MNGWMGKMAVVDLSKRECSFRGLDEATLRTYLGGRGLGMKLLADTAPADPLSPDNPLIFCPGTHLPAASRFSLTTRSPLTGTAFDANSGGSWGVRLKRCGIDALLVRGRASRPVYLAFGPGGIRIEDADHLWGARVSDTTRRLQAAEGKNASVACIGPAGESGSLIAAVMNDRSRTCARGGVGAVMGAKNLKAIVAAGVEPVEVADASRLAYVKKEAEKWLKANPVTAAGLPQFGTAVLVNLLNELGSFPAYNFRQSHFEDAEMICGETLAERFVVRRKACLGCPIACGRATRTAYSEGEGPEYESLWAMGALCGISDLEVITRANHLCNDLGIDTISAGSTIACAMELTDIGALEGGPLWGDGDALLGLLQDMAEARGLGARLALGSRLFADEMGAGHLAMQVKGLELPGYDPRGLQGQALAFATSNRGGCHLRAYMVGPEILGIPKLVDRFSTSDKPGLVIYNQNLNAAVDSLVLCRFVQFALSDEYFARMLEAVTGFGYAARDLHTIGERIWNLERLYNLAAGIEPASDTLPDRLLHEPVADGPAQGQVARIPEMLPVYYRARGWDEDGTPAPRKLDQLELQRPA
ncbi:MAG: aldehyde ferredoxin oxidoreductase family protein [Actinobacteria bacterium]|nr:aldehyde ferredoxin oxidoreductase family protein [Actinomycetota bacterium]